jgi:hypothetical protein
MSKQKPNYLSKYKINQIHLYLAKDIQLGFEEEDGYRPAEGVIKTIDAPN